MVLPLVPVTPTRSRAWAGWPSTAADSTARASRASLTRIQGTPGRGGSSEQTATAPFLRAGSTKRFPSVTRPRMATKSVPGPAWRESCVTAVTSVTGSPEI